MAAFVTQENIKFDGTLTNAIVLDDSDINRRKLIVWDKLPLDIQLTLEETINQYGGVLPIPQTAGKSVINFFNAKLAGDSTGITDTSTSASLVVKFEDDLLGTDATALSTDTGTPSSKTISFTSTKTGVDATGLANNVDANAILTVSGADIDGDINYSAVNVGISGNDIIIEHKDPANVSQPLSISVVGNTITVSLATDIGGIITSTGSDVVNAINADINANVLVSAANVGTGLSLVIATSPTNLIGGDSVVTYTATILGELVTIDGVTAQTFTDLINSVNGQLSLTNLTLDGSGILITNNISGNVDIDVIDTNLFSSLTGFSTIDATKFGIDAVTYTIDIEVNGTLYNVNVVGATNQTISDLLTTINSSIVGATMVISNSNLVLTSTSVGGNSIVRIVNDNVLNKLPSHLYTQKIGVGLNDEIYSILVNVDGSTQVLSIAGATISTIDDLVTQINLQLNGASAYVVNGGISIISSKLGKGSTIKVNSKLFTNLVDYKNIVEYSGVDDIFDVLRLNKHTNGTSYANVVANNIIVVGIKPDIGVVYDSSIVYHNGVGWVRYIDDVAI